MNQVEPGRRARVAERLRQGRDALRLVSSREIPAVTPTSDARMGPGWEPSPAQLQVWLAWMRSWRWNFRYSVEGLEHLDTPQSSLVVGYHGRPVAWDVLILHEVLYRRQGRLPLAIVHDGFRDMAFTRWLIEGLDWSTGDGEHLAAAARSGRHVLITPGGDREATRPGWIHNRVDWGQRTGFVRVAIEHGMPIVPVAASGVDNAYYGLNDGAVLGRKLNLKNRSPFWIALGPLGFYPWSPPFPVKVHQIVGEPIDVRATFGLVDVRDREGLATVAEHVQERVQRLLDQATAVSQLPHLKPPTWVVPGSLLP